MSMPPTTAVPAPPKPLPNHPVKLVVFDVDGTLVDSQHAIIGCMTTAFRSFGLPDPDPESVRRIVGLPLAEGIGRLVPHLAVEDHQRLAEGYREAFLRSRSSPGHPEELFPGVVAMLDALRAAGFLLGTATGKMMRGLRYTLERHGIIDRFATLQSGDQPPGKPHPAMLQRALAEVGIAPHQAVMIGDTSFDMEMAAAAGVPGIGVAWGYHAIFELKSAGAVHLVETCGDIPPLLASIGAPTWSSADPSR